MTPVELDIDMTEFLCVDTPSRVLNFAFVRVDKPEMFGITDGVDTIEVPRKVAAMLAVAASEIFDKAHRISDENYELGVTDDPNGERAMVRGAWGEPF